VVVPHLLDLVQQAVQGLTGKAVAVEGDQAAVGRYQRRNRVEVQRRRGVQVDPVVILGEAFEQLSQLVDLVLGLQLGLQVGQFGRGADQVQVVERCFEDRRARLLASVAASENLLEEVGNAGRNVIAGQAGQVVRGVGLGVQVHQQCAVALRCADRGQIAGDARLADTTLLIEHDPAHDSPPKNPERSSLYGKYDSRVIRGGKPDQSQTATGALMCGCAS